MTSPATPRSARIGFSAALLVALFAGSALTGCDDRTPTEKALTQSSRDIHSISGGSGPGVPAYETKKRQAVSASLTGVGDGASPAELAAAMTTLAQTQLGQAGPAKSDVINVEREAMLKEATIRALLGEWASRASLAASIESFDAGKAIAELNESIVTKQKEAIEFGARKRELDAKIADLKAKADASNAEGAAAEVEYAKLRDQAQSLSAVQAEPLIAQAATFKRKGDEAHIQAARYLAEADVMSPESAEAAQAVERTANQIKGLEDARKHLQDRTAHAKSEGQAARAEAESVASKLDQAVQDFKSYRAGAMDAAYAALAKAYSTAAGTAKKATQDKGGSSKMALGAAQQALGDLHWTRAKSEQKFALLMDRLASVTPELAKKAAYADDAKAGFEAKKSALESAKGAYEGAVSAYRAGGVKGQVKEQLDAVVKRLEAFATAAGDDKLDVLAVLAGAEKPAEDAAPAPTDEAPTAPEKPAEPAVATGEGRPFSQAPDVLAQNVTKFSSAARNGDVDELRTVLLIPDSMAATMDQLLKIQGAQGNLERALRKKFRKGVAEALGPMAAGLSGGTGGLAANGELDLGNATFTMPAEDTALVSVPGVAQPLTWKLVNDDWLLDLGLDKLPPGALDVVTKFADPLAGAFDELAADVNAGKIEAFEGVTPALMQKLMPILQQMQGGGGG
ncbi:MAG: hypothetical protein JNL50_08810 [Phycisphaerae bacterium]|nr:hypothetical protein [Phycisphaerae bacterium]